MTYEEYLRLPKSSQHQSLDNAILSQADTIELLNEDGNRVLYWVFGVVTYEGNTYGLLGEVIFYRGHPVPLSEFDHNGQRVLIPDDVPTGKLLIVHVTKNATEENYEEIPSDSELAAKLMDLFVANGFISPDNEDEQFNEFINKTLEGKIKDKAEIEKHLDSIQMELSKNNSNVLRDIIKRSYNK